MWLHVLIYLILNALWKYILKDTINKLVLNKFLNLTWAMAFLENLEGQVLIDCYVVDSIWLVSLMYKYHLYQQLVLNIMLNKEMTSSDKHLLLLIWSLLFYEISGYTGFKTFWLGHWQTPSATELRNSFTLQIVLSIQMFSRQHSKTSLWYFTLYLHEIKEDIKNSVLSNLIYECFGFVDKISYLWEWIEPNFMFISVFSYQALSNRTFQKVALCCALKISVNQPTK